MSRHTRIALALAAWLAAALSLFLPRWGLSVTFVCVWLGFVALQARKEQFRFSLRWLFGLIFVVAIVCWLIAGLNWMLALGEKNFRETHPEAQNLLR